MTRIRVAAAVLNQTPLDWAGNEQNILAAIAAARAEGVTVLCLPELCITGYGCEDAFHGTGLQAMVWKTLEAVLPATQGMVVSLGLPLLHRNALFNCACMAVDGRIAGFVAKRFLCGDGLHYEPRWFKPWPAGGPRHDPACRPGVSDRRPGVRLRRRQDRLRDLRGRLGGRPARRRHGAARRRHHPQPQRQPLRLRQARRPQAAGDRGLAGVPRQLYLCQPAGQRGGPGRSTTAGP